MDERRENITTFTWLPWQYRSVVKVAVLVKEYIVNYYIFVNSLVDDLSTWLGS